MKTLMPKDHAKRSFIYHQQPAASYTLIDDAVLMDEIELDESNQLATCALIDLSNVARFGLRGPDCQHVLQQCALPFPLQPNQCASLEGGQTVIRLSKTECWVLASLTQINKKQVNEKPGNETQGNECLKTLAEQAAKAKCYPLYCQDSHAWFALTGEQLPTLMAKLCGVDLRCDSFPVGTVVQTSVARVNAIIVHHTLSGKNVFSILSDSAQAGYLWGALLDAMSEFNAKAMGVRRLLG